MTTLYIEEVSDEEDSSYGNVDTPSEVDDGATSPFEIEHLPHCPKSIGGGASVTMIGLKAFVFGGCDRMGMPSNSLHCYNFGMFSSSLCLQNPIFRIFSFSSSRLCQFLPLSNILFR